MRDFIGHASKSCVFFMTASDADRDCAIEFCKKCEVCHPSRVISPDSEKSRFYDLFYDILSKDLKMFDEELKGIRETSQVGVLKNELNGLIAKLESRNTTTISQLTKQCMDKIKTYVLMGIILICIWFIISLYYCVIPMIPKIIFFRGTKFGIVGYRLCGNELLVFKDGNATKPNKKRKKIEKSIESLFKGTIQFIELKEFLTPHCAVECGGTIQNSRNSRKGTIGIFGMVKQANGESCFHVAITSPHVVSEGESAGLSNGSEIGRCIWPPDELIHNVSVIRINEDLINSLQKTRFDKKIIIQEISNQILLNKKVFKYGAGTQKTVGWIAKIDNFELYGRNVMAILPNRSNLSNLFSDKGDSGAIVLTKIKGEYYAVGMIFGGGTVSYLAECSSVQRESIAIFLKPALDDLRMKGGVHIEFDKI